MHQWSLHQLSRWEWAMHSTIEASKMRKGKSAYNPWTHISHKDLYTYCKTLLALEEKYYYACPWRDRLVGKDHRSSPTATHKESTQRAPHAANLSHNFYHTCMLRDLPTLTWVFLSFKITQLAHSNVTTFISQNTYQVSNFSWYSMKSIWEINFTIKANYHAVLKTLKII